MTAQPVELSVWDKKPYVFINDDLPGHVEDAIDEQLSYKVPDAEYTDAWKNNEWDGYERLFRESRNGSQYFPIGCLDQVRSVLDAYDINYRVSGLTRPGQGDLDLPWQSDMEMRDYQQDAIEEALSRGSGVIVLPTGAGKTLIGLRLMHLLKRPTIVTVHLQEVAEQWCGRIDDVLGVEPARYFGGDRESGDIMVALYQSIYEDGEIRDDVRLDHDIFLADECIAGDAVVTMADGSTKPMKDVKIGDWVLSVDESGRLEPKPVTMKWDKGVREVVNVNGLVCTPDHEFFTPDGKVEARSLDSEDSDGKVEARSLDSEDSGVAHGCSLGVVEAGEAEPAGEERVYDIEVADNHNFFADGMLVSNCHRVGAETFSRVALSIQAPYRYGFSATPEREDNATLRVIGGTGPMIADLSASKLIDEGYLAEPEWRIYEAPTVGGAFRTWQAEYKACIVENEERNEMIAESVEKLNKPTLISVERINHGERLESLIPDAKLIHGDHPERDERIAAFRDGDLDVLIATRGIVGEGFDVPEIESFVVAGGLKSSTSMIQQVGRALRPGETGTAQIVDFVDRGEYVADHSEERIRTYKEYYGDYGP